MGCLFEGGGGGGLYMSHNEANQNRAHSNRVAIGRCCWRMRCRLKEEPGASGSGQESPACGAGETSST